MSIFALENLSEIKNGKLSFHKLIIDDECLYDKFCNEIENDKIHLFSLNKIRTYMNLLAESDMQLPATKFNSIKGSGDKVIGYEFKYKVLRVYIIKQTPNVYVVLGGYKNNQKKDIKKFKRITVEFLKSIEK